MLSSSIQSIKCAGDPVAKRAPALHAAGEGGSPQSFAPSRLMKNTISGPQSHRALLSHTLRSFAIIKRGDFYNGAENYCAR
jgi:hypothetical protein